MPLSNYQLFDPPFPLEYTSWPKKQAEAYLTWFIANIPERLAQLRRALFSDRGPEIPLDMSPQSLTDLWPWFASQVRARPRTSGELEEEQARMPGRFRAVVTDTTLTAETISLCIDVGIYLGELYRARHPGLTWDIVRRPKNDADFQRPVVVPFMHVQHMNPVRICTVRAYKVLDGSDITASWPGVFEYWDGKAAA